MKKILSRSVLVILVLILIGLGLIYFLPDYDLYLVRSESMKPAVNMGDLIITGPVGGPINGEIQPGTIITYNHQKGNRIRSNVRG